MWADRKDAITEVVANGEAVAAGGFADQLHALEELRAPLEQVGSPQAHPFRGVLRLDELSPDERTHLNQLVFDALEALRLIPDSAAQVSRLLGLRGGAEITLAEAKQIADLALRVLDAPPMDRTHIGNRVWVSDRERIQHLVQEGEALDRHKNQLSDTVADFACSVDLVRLRRILASYGGSWFRWFFKEYRDASAELRSLLTGRPPRRMADRLAIVDGLIAIATGTKALDQDDSNTQLGRDAFGTDWKGSKSDWSRLAAIVHWDSDCTRESLPGDHRQILAALADPQPLAHPPIVSRRSWNKRTSTCAGALGVLSIDFKQAFGVDLLAIVPVAALVDRLRIWYERPDALAEWIRYERCCRRMQSVGLGDVLPEVQEGRISLADAESQVQKRFHQALLRKAAIEFPAAPPEPGAKPPDTGAEGGEVVERLARAAFGPSWHGSEFGLVQPRRHREVGPGVPRRESRLEPPRGPGPTGRSRDHDGVAQGAFGATSTFVPSISATGGGAAARSGRGVRYRLACLDPHPGRGRPAQFMAREI